MELILRNTFSLFKEIMEGKKGINTRSFKKNLSVFALARHQSTGNLTEKERESRNNTRETEGPKEIYREYERRVKKERDRGERKKRRGEKEIEKNTKIEGVKECKNTEKERDREKRSERERKRVS